MSVSEKEIKAFFKATTEDWSKNWGNMVEEEVTKDIFTFKPSEFVLVEELEYDETIQRPEAIRFYTLDEQVGDAYEKMVPRGRTTKFKMEVLRKEAERLRQLYLDHIVPTSDDYLLREPEYGKKFSWIHPVVDTEAYRGADSNPYSIEKTWAPLFDTAHVRLPNFYSRMLAALPRPYVTEGIEGVSYPIKEITEFVDADGKDPSRALPTFMYPRTQRHEDGRFDILNVPMPNTADVTKFIGYYADKRPVPVPNPLPGHDFLKSSDAFMIETTAPLSEVVPSLDAILTHAVPVTRDPYGEGMKYLRVYDVQLSDIPWSSWKSRFPPVEMHVAKEVEKIEFPKSRGDKPSENLLQYYTEYSPAQSTRQWLMDQQDGGELVVHMLMSKAGQNGTVAMSPGADGDFEYPKTTIKECELEGLDFHDFSIRGVLRRTWGAKDKITYQCIPLELIKQERKREGYKNRTQWKEKTHEEILESYVKALVSGRPLKPFVPKDSKAHSEPAREVSHLRHEIIVVLGDKQRLPEDKVRDVTDLVRDAVLEGNVFVDSKGLFLVCLHTMAILMGDLAEDKRTFYDNWTARVDGFRVCKSCGEHVNADVLENQDEFTDEGRVIRHADVLETKAFDSQGAMDHVKTLSQLRDLFTFSNPSDEVFFMLISLLYIVPEVDQLLPILTMGRKLAAQLEQAKLDGGAAGIAQAVLLIQSHVPPLVPRRSFSSKPLTLRGYPRDAAKPDGYTIVDSLMMVLSKTLEAYPTSFKGSSATTMRSVLNAPKKVRDLVVKVITTLLGGKESGPLFKTAFERARAVLPAEEPTKPSTMIPGDLALPAKDAFGSIRSPPTCPTTRVYWTNARLPNVKQPDVALRDNITHFTREGSIKTKMIEKPVSERVEPKTTNVKDKEVIARLKKGKEGVFEDWHTNMLLATRLGSVFEMPMPVQSLDPDQKPDDLRDITKGYVFEIVKEVGNDPIKKTKFDAMKKGDLALMMLTADVKKAVATTNSLKAKERYTVTERMRMMPDAEREITKDLMDRGLAPFIIGTQDRLLFAREVAEEESDTGVGRTVDDEDDGVGNLPQFEDMRTRGQYGDFSGSNAAGGNIAETAYGQQNDFEGEDGQI